MKELELILNEWFKNNILLNKNQWKSLKEILKK